MDDTHILERMNNVLKAEEGLDDKTRKESLKLVHNVFRYLDKDAKDIMTHRKNIVAFDGELTLEEALREMLEDNHSRYPVYKEDIDGIFGVLHLREAISAFITPELRQTKLVDLTGCVREVTVIPETRSIDAVFREMQSEKMHLMVVLDEYGQTSGVVTLEDIIEELMGDIMDEYDEEEEEVVVQSDGTYIVDGLMDLEALDDLLPIAFSTEDYETLNGFMIDKLERIPAEDEDCEVLYEGYKFTVLSVDNNTIGSVKIEKLD